MRYAILAVVMTTALGIAPAAAQETLTVGRCPHPIILDRLGLWANASENQASLAQMRANPARKAKVATVFVAPDGSYFNVLGLAALEAHQGRISRADYEKVKAEYRQAVADGMPAELPRRIQQLEKGSSSGRKLAGYSFDRFEDRGTEFVMYGTTSVATPTGNILYHTAQRIVLINGCQITLNFGFPAQTYTIQNMESAVSQLGLR